MSAMTDLVAEVHAEADLFRAGAKAINGLIDQVAAINAANANDPAIAALVVEMKANAAQLATAIPAAPLPPPAPTDPTSTPAQ